MEARPPRPIPCPSCGFLVSAGGFGSFDICQICGWHDCAVQFGNPLDAAGPNRTSLVDHQREAIERWPMTVRSIECEGRVIQRDPDWRPLTEDEIASYRQSTKNGNELTHD